jgi:hypothetical protein
MSKIAHGGTASGQTTRAPIRLKKYKKNQHLIGYSTFEIMEQINEGEED